MNKTIFCIIVLIFVLTTIGCVDKSASAKLCEEKGYQLFDTTLSCDIVCIDLETGEKHTYDGNCNVNIDWG